MSPRSPKPKYNHSEYFEYYFFKYLCVYVWTFLSPLLSYLWTSHPGELGMVNISKKKCFFTLGMIYSRPSQGFFMKPKALTSIIAVLSLQDDPGMTFRKTRGRLGQSRTSSARREWLREGILRCEGNISCPPSKLTIIGKWTLQGRK